MEAKQRQSCKRTQLQYIQTWYPLLNMDSNKGTINGLAMCVTTRRDVANNTCVCVSRVTAVSCTHFPRVGGNVCSQVQPDSKKLLTLLIKRKSNQNSSLQNISF